MSYVKISVFSESTRLSSGTDKAFNEEIMMLESTSTSLLSGPISLVAIHPILSPDSEMKV
jgi:hypothetical protein